MSFLVLFVRLPRVIFLLGAWRSLPFIFNVWLRILRGLLVIFLFQNGERASGVSLLIVEERLSLTVIITWFLYGGGIFILILLAIKSALPPFQAWLIRVLSSCKREIFVWAISAHKMPVVMFFMRFKVIIMLRFLVFSIGIGVLFLLRLGGIRRIVILSSRNVFSSAILFFWFWGNEGILFFFCYCLVIWRAIVKRKVELDRIFFLIGLMGLPPFILFQIKLMILLSLLAEAWEYAFILVFISAISVLVYIRFCFLINVKYTGNARSLLGAWALFRGGIILI